MSNRKKNTPENHIAISIDENALFKTISKIIENRKNRAGSLANREVTLMYWEVGRYINISILGEKRAEYNKQIFSTLSRKLVDKFGKSFERENLYRMAQFAKLFPESN